MKRGRSIIKRYGVIFTCLVLRTIHIKVVRSSDTSSLIQVLRGFIARRGPVIEIRLDNATNFVGAEKKLKLSIEKWNHNVIHKFCCRNKESGYLTLLLLPLTAVYGSDASDRFEKC